MAKKKNEKNVNKEELTEKETSGKKFEDLTAEEMDTVQGQGDKGVPEKRGIWDIFTSTGEYKCK